MRGRPNLGPVIESAVAHGVDGKCGLSNPTPAKDWGSVEGHACCDIGLIGWIKPSWGQSRACSGTRDWGFPVDPTPVMSAHCGGPADARPASGFSSPTPIIHGHHHLTGRTYAKSASECGFEPRWWPATFY